MIETALFGSTGHRSSRIIFGAAALGGMSQDRADVTLAQLAPAGVNHIDSAASYGESELRLAPFLAEPSPRRLSGHQDRRPRRRRSQSFAGAKPGADGSRPG